MVPKVGDRCCADPEEEGEFEYGVITQIQDGLACTNIKVPSMGNTTFVGDIPVRMKDGVWVFTSF